MKLLKVTINWADSAVFGGWRDIESYQQHRPQQIETTGYLVAHTPSHLTVVQSVGHPFMAECVTIPKGCVTSMEVLGSTEYPPAPTDES